MRIRDSLLGLAVFLFCRVGSWLCSLPMWLTLTLHFLFDLPLIWFWATLAVWLIVGLLRWLMILFARRCDTPEPEKENKNPYSVRDK